MSHLLEARGPADEQRQGGALHGVIDACADLPAAAMESDGVPAPTRRWLRMLRHLGLRVCAQGLWATVCELGWDLRLRNFGIWQFDLPGDLLQTPQPAAEINFGKAAIQVIDRARQRGMELPSVFFDPWLRETSVCFAAKLGGQVAGVGWFRDHRQARVFLRLQQGEGAIRSLYTLPQFRGLGVAKQIIVSIGRWGNRQGYHRLFAVIDSANLSSQRAFRSLGFLKVSQLKRIGLFGPRYVSGPYRPESAREVLGIPPGRL